MELSDTERQSALWLKIKAYAEERLEANRKKNDGDLDERETARLRGRIKELKDLLDKGDPSRPAITDSDPRAAAGR